MRNLYDHETRNPIDFDDEGLIALCPHCGHNSTHQGEVQVWDRQEDDDVGCWVRVRRGDLTSCPVLPKGNPSPRRSGLRIQMECEDCDYPFALVVVQHKGATYIYFEAFTRKGESFARIGKD